MRSQLINDVEYFFSWLTRLQQLLPPIDFRLLLGGLDGLEVDRARLRLEIASILKHLLLLSLNLFLHAVDVFYFGGGRCKSLQAWTAMRTRELELANGRLPRIVLGARALDLSVRVVSLRPRRRLQKVRDRRYLFTKLVADHVLTHVFQFLIFECHSLSRPTD